MTTTGFLADVTFLTPEEGGRTKPVAFVMGHLPLISSMYGYQVVVNIRDILFLTIPLHPSPETVNYMELKPGETGSLLFELGEGCPPVEIGESILLQEGNKVVAKGIIIALI